MRAIEISGDDATSLANTLNFVRDAEFSDTDLNFDESTKTVTIRLLPPSVSRGSLQSLVLLFRGVHGVQMRTVGAGPGPHPIGSLKWQSDGHVAIETYDGLTIHLAASRLDGTLTISSDQP